MFEADRRVHGTTFERPIDRFERAESVALRALPALPLPAREQRLRRRVANDALVDVDTVRYSVPHQYVRTHVEVAVGEREVRIYRGRDEIIARHARSLEPHSLVRDSKHYEGLWRQPTSTSTETAKLGGLAVYGRSLAEYEAALLPEVTA